MIKKKNKIGWQKYEDVLENQLSSPLLQMILEQAIKQEEEKETIISQEEFTDEDIEESFVPIITVSQELAHDAALASNFDCWVGHTNFDITPTILTTLNEIEGVEILKLFSRYRFFIGVGRMFKFKNVRKDLETQLL